MKTKLISFILVILLAGMVFPGNKTNKFYLDELKQSGMDVIAKNQSLINTNKDGSKAHKGITPEKFGKKSYEQFRKMISREEWKIKDLKSNNDYEQLARALTNYLAAARIFVAKSQKKINTDANGKINPKHFYPAVFGRLTAGEFFNRTGIQMKQTTTGKGMGPRNPKYNTPDSWEKAALAKLESPGWTRGQGVGEYTNEDGHKYYRYIQPLEIKKACLGCHGSPRGEKDISGHIKEGYSLNDVRGGISVKIPVN